jgi:hypothetical protein
VHVHVHVHVHMCMCMCMYMCMCMSSCLRDARLEASLEARHGGQLRDLGI